MTSLDQDAPRRLTEEEIERAITAIPYPHAVTKDHAAFARDQILVVVRADLMNVEICPSAIDELIERIVTQFEESRVKPGSMVGFAAAEAPSNRFQQDALSSVHKAGQIGMKGTSGAVGRLADLISKQQSKNASDYDACTVFFTDVQTQHSILHDKRGDMVAVNIAALLKVKGNDPTDGPQEPYIIEYQKILFPDGKLPAWYYIYSELYGVPMPEVERRDTGRVLRLNLDLEKVVEYRVMVSELRRALLSSNSRVLRYYVSPMHIGIIDIWALDEEFHSYGLDISGDPDLDVYSTLQGFATRLDLFMVKGIPGIRDVQAAKFDIWPIMTLGQSYRHIKGHIFEYRLSSIWPMRFGWERPRQLWHFLGITVQSYDEKNSSWVILDGSSAAVPAAPHDLIRNAVDADETDSRDYQRTAVATGKAIVTRPVTPMNTTYWSQLWYAKTDGTNLRELTSRNDVDRRYTISNRPFEVLELYGIVAARRVMLEELYLAFGGGRDEPNFSVRHFSIIADFVCHTGVIRQISNLLIQGRSTLSKATFARQFNTLVVPSIHGVDEPIGDVSAAIMVAARAKIGPRAFEYEGTINQGITSSQIKDSLRAGSRSTGEMDKLISTLAETTYVPLYTTGNEGASSVAAASALMGGQDDDAEADAEFIKEYEASAAALPPGLADDDEDEETTTRRQNLIIDDDEDGAVDFSRSAGAEEEPEEPKKRRSTRSRKTSATVVMAPALAAAIKSMDGTIMTATARSAAPPPCLPEPRKSALRTGAKTRGKSKALTFVGED
jgi:hypothetical protein